MKKLIFFLNSQRTGSSFTAELFKEHGVSLGNYSFFSQSQRRPLGCCESMPVFNIDRTLHRQIYGFAEDSIQYKIAGRIMKMRDVLRPKIEDIDPQIIKVGIETIQNFIDTPADENGKKPEIFAIKHPSGTLFWFFWKHIFEQFPELEIHPIFLLRSPSGIAASYGRRSKKVGFQIENMFDLIEVFYSRMREIYDSWEGQKDVIRYNDAFFQTDLQKAIENCGLKWNKKTFQKVYKADKTVKIDTPVIHDCQKLYDDWLEIFNE